MTTRICTMSTPLQFHIQFQYQKIITGQAPRQTFFLNSTIFSEIKFHNFPRKIIFQQKSCLFFLLRFICSKKKTTNMKRGASLLTNNKKSTITTNNQSIKPKKSRPTTTTKKPKKPKKRPIVDSANLANSKKKTKEPKKTEKSKKTKNPEKELTLRQEVALDQLDKLLTQLEIDFPFKTFPVGDITTKDDLKPLEQFYDETGLLFITDATTDSSFENAKQNFVSAFIDMFKYDIPPEDISKITPNDINSINQFRSPKFGAGNASFAYLNKQYTDLAKTPTASIAGEEIYLALNTVHSMVNLPLLMENPHTCAVLMALTHPTGMVSWDSAKYANNPKPKPKTMTKQTLTKFHFDMYGNTGAGDRQQAIIVREDDVKLGYLPYSNRPEVQLLIAQALGKNDLYERDGFIGTDEPHLTKVLEKHLIAPKTNSLVIWKEKVIHAEATFNEANSYGYCTFSSRSDQPNSPRYRFVVGLHKPINLTTTDLTELARLCENGLIPDFYFNHNRGTKVHDNIKNGKSTQYKKPREITPEERKHIETVVSDTNDTLGILSEMSPLKKHLYGITQPFDQLGFSEADCKLLSK